jgi:hypothetical protein
MSVIATFIVDSDSFPLGKSIEGQPTAEIEIERIVPMREGTFPFIFVWEHTNYEQFEQQMESIPEVELIELLETFEDGRLYEISWESDSTPLLPDIIANDGTILSARGDSTAWTFELRFANHANVSRFFRDATANSELDMRLKSLVQEVRFESTEDRSLLTQKQERALGTAFEMGYFDVPREAHLDDVAAALGISSSSTSALLRRGCSRFFKHHFTQE